MIPGSKSQKSSCKLACKRIFGLLTRQNIRNPLIRSGIRIALFNDTRYMLCCQSTIISPLIIFSSIYFYKHRIDLYFHAFQTSG